MSKNSSDAEVPIDELCINKKQTLSEIIADECHTWLVTDKLFIYLCYIAYFSSSDTQNFVYLLFRLFLNKINIKNGAAFNKYH